MIYGNPLIFGGSGGSGPSASDAILTVTVLTGSTVTMTKDGVTLTPTMWVQAADATLDCALFVITPAQFDSVNPWTVTATLGTSSETTTIYIIIDSNKQYDVNMERIWLYYRGDQCLSKTGGWVATTNPSLITFDSDKISFTYSSSVATISTVNELSTTGYTNLKAIVNVTRTGNNLRLGIRSGAQVTSENFTSYTHYGPSTLGEQTVTLDITSTQGNYYVGISRWQCGFSVLAIWLE